MVPGRGMGDDDRLMIFSGWEEGCVLMVSGKEVVARSTSGPFLRGNTITVSNGAVMVIKMARRMGGTCPSTRFISTGNKIVVPTFVGTRRRVCDSFTENLDVGKCGPRKFLSVLSNL